jgi:hypothetical protein
MTSNFRHLFVALICVASPVLALDAIDRDTLGLEDFLSPHERTVDGRPVDFFSSMLYSGVGIRERDRQQIFTYSVNNYYSDQWQFGLGVYNANFIRSVEGVPGTSRDIDTAWFTDLYVSYYFRGYEDGLISRFASTPWWRLSAHCDLEYAVDISDIRHGYTLDLEGKTYIKPLRKSAFFGAFAQLGPDRDLERYAARARVELFRTKGGSNLRYASMYVNEREQRDHRSYWRNDLTVQLIDIVGPVSLNFGYTLDRRLDMNRWEHGATVFVAIPIGARLGK